MNLNPVYIRLIYFALILACFIQWVSPALALIIGLGLSIAGIKFPALSKRTALILQTSVVLMGFGMSLTQVVEASGKGILFTASTVLLTVIAGMLLGRALRVESKIAVLISAGTAICGGSAIAALAPVLNARNYQISFSLIVVFILNALALLLFPYVGHVLGLNQDVFGYWAAVAIHDTSSVVGAGAAYGAQALEIATAVKLTRVFWIIPVSLAFSFINRKDAPGKIRIPWFIGFFILSVLVTHWTPTFSEGFQLLSWVGRRGMVVALMLIGSGMSVSESKQAGVRSFALGGLLWVTVASVSLIMILHHAFGV